ncbi:hypothetical protein IV203_031494 [Nitzschia inconspicua]|uniref:Uncharacterized protein n=1 Tax=Nitzschia inconspicua TaxID=303405 RepID=A0A9K3LX69_9STRA|nr:hypothetical protein IV203_031494 [Nitzschia inconspicua]
MAMLITMENGNAFSAVPLHRRNLAGRIDPISLRGTLEDLAAEDSTMPSPTPNPSRRQIVNIGVTAALSLLAADSAVAADSATSLDFSLPKYDTKMQGFGEGSEVYTSKLRESDNSGNPVSDFTDPGANEKDKQLRSMQLAEEARQAALAKKKAEAKMREEEDRRRAAEKKAKNAERFASIFS